MEFRQIRGDGAWMSPHPIDSLGIHISFNGDPKWFPEVTNAVSLLEKALQPFNARAHWGKLAPLTFAPSSTQVHSFIHFPSIYSVVISQSAEYMNYLFR
mmetsp:Transcript_174/g.209  ORF Transcript_174/g.209 Transcript_174/m.209 type:complete len:99 (+) Transcript_174:64-360(+)